MCLPIAHAGTFGSALISLLLTSHFRSTRESNVQNTPAVGPPPVTDMQRSPWPEPPPVLSRLSKGRSPLTEQSALRTATGGVRFPHAPDSGTPLIQIPRGLPVTKSKPSGLTELAGCVLLPQPVPALSPCPSPPPYPPATLVFFLFLLLPQGLCSHPGVSLLFLQRVRRSIF